MTLPEVKEAIEKGVLVGTSSVSVKGGFCLYSTGHLVKMVKVRGKKEKECLFRDTFGEVEVVRPASQFSFAN